VREKENKILKKWEGERESEREGESKKINGRRRGRVR
jgi:hypothetical protein